jgi:hypothetical protein
MLRGMFVRGRVAAAYMAAGHAQSQVNPRGADAQTVFTAVGAGGNLFDLIEMSTNVGHMNLLIGFGDARGK